MGSGDGGGVAAMSGKANQSCCLGRKCSKPKRDEQKH